ncbi:tetratricopeptide repeat protein [Actinomadura keratinilytica]
MGRAIEEFRADGNRPSEASALSNLSRVLLQNGEHAEAVALAERALAIYNEVGLTWRLANAMYALGLALAASGRHEEAVDQLSGALPVFQENRQPLWEGMTLFRMAEIALDTGGPPRPPPSPNRPSCDCAASAATGGAATSSPSSARRSSPSASKAARAPAGRRHWACTSV